MSELTIRIDAVAQGNAEQASALLQKLRERFDLAQFEFTKEIRIAPDEVPHSHPVLTLNAFLLDNENMFLSTYLHEQIHWYLTDHRAMELSRAIEILQQRYPDVPSPESERARDEYSIYLHLVVNWLQIEATGKVIGRGETLRLFDEPFVYRWIYGAVIRDWRSIGGLLSESGISPMPDARSLSTILPER